MRHILHYPFGWRHTDGTSRYFDIQGRMLHGKPDKGLYIENGKKVMK